MYFNISCSIKPSFFQGNIHLSFPPQSQTNGQQGSTCPAAPCSLSVSPWFLPAHCSAQVYFTLLKGWLSPRWEEPFQHCSFSLATSLPYLQRSTSALLGAQDAVMSSVLSSVCPGLTSAQVLAPICHTRQYWTLLEKPLAIFSTQGQAQDNTTREDRMDGDGWAMLRALNPWIPSQSTTQVTSDPAKCHR